MELKFTPDEARIMATALQGYADILQAYVDKEES